MSEKGVKASAMEETGKQQLSGEQKQAAREELASAGPGGESVVEPALKKPRLSSAPKFAPKELQVEVGPSTKPQQLHGRQPDIEKQAAEQRSMPRHQHAIQQMQQGVKHLTLKHQGSLLAVKEIATDKLSRVARRNWSYAARARDPPPAFKPELVSAIYREELGGARMRGHSFKGAILLEVSQYLENYLWPNFDPDKATYEHVMSILFMVNEKFRENVPAWTCFHTREDTFPAFFKRVLSLKEGLEDKLRMHERTAYVLFMIRAFQSLEDEMVRAQVLRVVSLPLWHALSPGRLQLELHAQEALAKHWKAAAKKEAKAAKKAKGGVEGEHAYVPVVQRPDVRFLPSLLDEFLAVLDKVIVPPPGPGCFPELNGAALQYCERFLEFLIDLLSQLPTRRFVRTLLDDRALLIKCRMSKLFKYTPPPPGAMTAAKAAAKVAKEAARAAAKAAAAGGAAEEAGRQLHSNGGPGAEEEDAEVDSETSSDEDSEGAQEDAEQGTEGEDNGEYGGSSSNEAESDVEEEGDNGAADGEQEGKDAAERPNEEAGTANAEDAANDAVADGRGDPAIFLGRGRGRGRGGRGQGRGRGRSHRGGGRGRDSSGQRRRRSRARHGAPTNMLFRQLVDLFAYYMTFPIDDHTGEPLTDDDITAAHYEKVCQFQRLCFKHWAKMESLYELALSNCGAVEQRDNLRRHLSALSPDQLRHMACRQLRLVAEDDPWAADAAFLMEVLISTYERRRSQREVVNEMPLYPTEGLLWDESQIPASSEHYTGEGALALPKLNLQFLTVHDYLLRNFHLFRLEATYEIREDIADVLGRMGAYWGDDDRVRFAGWARMALPLSSFKITEVRKPNVGDAKPAAVTANVLIDTRPLRGDVRAEWDELKQHDVLFLLTVRPPTAAAAAAAFADGREPNVAEKHGLAYVRGCEVIEVRDEGGRLMNDFTGRVRRDEVKLPEGFSRTVTVALDTAQYQIDMNTMAKHKSEDPYSTFNLVMRRKPKENNFKAVLESIRDLMNDESAVIPPWLHDVFLGYGDPGAAQARVPGTNVATGAGADGDAAGVGGQPPLQTVDFGDTFLDAEHVVEAFPQFKVTIINRSGGPKPVPPFRVTFPTEPATDEPSTSGPDCAGAAGAEASASVPVAPRACPDPGELLVESYVPPDPGPYPQDQPRRNAVRFTPVQVEAIASGVQPGLTMVVGPPGTGKTDTAVQIMTVLYHNCPGQRTLLITHSNQALNDLFSKIMERDVPERYLLRLGMGEAELDTEQDFSRVGRVNAMLARRLELLAEVEKMARQLGVPEAESVAYTCETAGYFWLIHVLARWEKFTAAVERARTASAGPTVVSELFPFKEYFADAPQPLFGGKDFEQDMERARGCFRHLRTLFQELEECRAFELLKGQADRVNYLSTKQAKIVAMTCTHAALKRREFLQLSFQYDNLLMEEAAQILEIETFIPMLLQKAEDGVSRLKRIVFIGDHHQLPPVVKNQAFQKYSHLDQSLFTRFIRLGTPYLQLNAQGRARPSLARLYNWRYKALGDLPAVQQGAAFRAANPGFAFDFQLVDVPDYLGRGESEPVPYFYQNLGEAEYVVATYMYMRLLGYPAHKISILTTYNGQKALIRDVVEQRCAPYPAFGRPYRIATVDKYQGAQNDYILLSLVRTRTVGHLRDVRRLVVAMSRARLGLYIFGRKDLFANCYELQPAFRQLLARPTQLALVKGESYDVCTRGLEDPVQFEVIPGLWNMSALVAAITEEQAAAVAAAAEVQPYEQFQEAQVQPAADPTCEDSTPKETAGREEGTEPQGGSSRDDAPMDDVVVTGADVKAGGVEEGPSA